MSQTLHEILIRLVPRLLFSKTFLFDQDHSDILIFSYGLYHLAWSSSLVII